MKGIQIVFVRDLPQPMKATENGGVSLEKVFKADGLAGSSFSSEPSLVPHVFLDGEPVGLLRSASIRASADQPVPTVLLERYLFYPNDEILTLSSMEFARWDIEREFRLFTKFVTQLPLPLQAILVKEKVIDPEVAIVDVSCAGRGMSLDKKLFEELAAKHWLDPEFKVIS